MSLITRPMLASELENESLIKYPVYVTPKVDGIRCLKIDGQILTRNFKPLPNKYIRKILEDLLPEGADGEVISGNTFQKCQSNVMSFDGEPEFKFYWFDWVQESLLEPYKTRCDRLFTYYLMMVQPAFLFGFNPDPDKEEFEKYVEKYIHPLTPTPAENFERLKELEKLYVEDGGFEGLMLRSADGPYKCGRSTGKEAYLLKYKKFSDSEAEIVGFEEKLKNNNEVTLDKFGKKKRSSKKENKVPANTLGAITVRDIHSKFEFNIGSGFDDNLKKEIWDNQKDFLGKIVKYKYFEKGVKQLPRFPVFLGFRHENDMSS